MYQELSAEPRSVPSRGKTVLVNEHPEGAEPRSVPAKGKALLVDEYPEDLQYYFNILDAHGYRVKACSSYQEGVRCLGDEVFDFVVVSQGTPKFEGSCVLERATEANRGLPVLVVARCLDMGCYLEAMQLGAVDYLVEPLTVWEVSRVLENHPTKRSMAV
jgi:DNA-binding NtrC family response regulator